MTAPTLVLICPLCDARVSPRPGSPTPGPNATVTCLRDPWQNPHLITERRHLIVDPDLGGAA